MLFRFSVLLFSALSCFSWSQVEAQTCREILHSLGLDPDAAQSRVEERVLARTANFRDGADELVPSNRSARGFSQSARSAVERPFIDEIFRNILLSAQKSFEDFGAVWAKGYAERLQVDEAMSKAEEAKLDEEIAQIVRKQQEIQRQLDQIPDQARLSKVQKEKFNEWKAALQVYKTRLDRLEAVRYQMRSHRSSLEDPSERELAVLRDPFYQANHSAFEVLRLSMEKADKGPTDVFLIRDPERRRRVAEVAINGLSWKLSDEKEALELKSRLQLSETPEKRFVFNGIVAEKFAEFEALAKAELANIRLDYEGARHHIRWTFLEEEANRIFAELRLILQRRFPLGFEQSDLDLIPQESRAFSNLQATQERIKRTAKPLSIDEFRAQRVGDELVLEVGGGIKVIYDPLIGTMMLVSAKGEFANEGPSFVAWHGDGTTQSNAGSFRSTLPLIGNAGFNVFAVALPNSGPIPSVAMDFTALEDVSAHMRAIYARIQERDPMQSRPMVAFGRSAGSTKGQFDFFLQEVLYPLVQPGYQPQAPVDAFVLSSFSNPDTLEDQIKSVYEQYEAGLFEIVEESLTSFQGMAAEYRQLLAALRDVDSPLLQAIAMDRVLLLQGVSDEDGGPHVIREHDKFRGSYMPRAHNIIFQNPLLNPDKYPELVRNGVIDVKKVSPEVLEGTHFLLSSRDDLSEADIRKIFPGINIDPADYPKLKTQSLHVFAATYIHLDYLADLSPFRDLPGHREVADRIRANRAKIGTKTYLEWVLKGDMFKKKLGKEKWQEVEPSWSGTLAQRIRVTVDYFQKRAVEQAQFLPEPELRRPR